MKNGSIYLNWYLKVSGSIESITGHTTFVWFSAILLSKGSSHPSVTSQWESRNVNTSPEAWSAPRSLPLQFELIFTKNATVLLYLINPTLSLDLIIFTLPQAIKCSSNLLKCGNVEPSSTKITSLQNIHFNQLEILRPLRIPYKSSRRSFDNRVHCPQ